MQHGMRQRGPSWIVVPESETGRAFVPLFARTNFDVSTGDFTTRSWAKLCINAPGAISAILLKPTGVIRHGSRRRRRCVGQP